ncbi:MAG: 30S ribosomal protein S11 [Opitutales bacterium]
MSEDENKPAPEAKPETAPEEPKVATPVEESKAATPAAAQAAKPKDAEPAKTKEAEGAKAKDGEAKAEGDSKTDGKEEKSGQPTAADLLSDNLGELKIRKAKGSKNVTTGICNILATFNNTKVSFADANGNIISWSSSGKCNFRGSRKSTAYAAQVVTQDAGKVAMSHGMREVEVRVKGPGMGRDSAVRALQSLGFVVSAIRDVTPVPHNGCRPPKRRRV